MNQLLLAAIKAMDLAVDRWTPEQVVVKPINPDGSLRRFYRLVGPGGQRILAVQPSGSDVDGQREATSTFEIGRHLYRQGVPVPEIYGIDESTGTVFMEDLGDQRLHDLLASAADGERMAWYRRVVAELARMQVKGIRSFEPSWCWDGCRYDQRLMLERESGYFLQALCRGYLKVPFDNGRVEAECRQLAERAGSAPSDFFLHRDFQSRNIMIKENRVRIIDFQGGRIGPLAYDLASLLIDPYMELPEIMQDEIRQVYLRELNGYIPYDHLQFEQEYTLLALQRNMQILGAFAFLSQQRQKTFFSRFIRPALLSLKSLLAKPEAAEYVALGELTRRCLMTVERLSQEQVGL